MGKPTAQGTAWESSIRNRALLLGRTARRNAKLGQAHESDVTVEGQRYIPAVFWKQYAKRDQRRRTTSMVVLLEEDFWNLYALDTEHTLGLEVQAKATERLGLVSTMLGLVSWMHRK